MNFSMNTCTQQGWTSALIRNTLPISMNFSMNTCTHLGWTQALANLYEFHHKHLHTARINIALMNNTLPISMNFSMNTCTHQGWTSVLANLYEFHHEHLHTARMNISIGQQHLANLYEFHLEHLITARMNSSVCQSVWFSPWTPALSKDEQTQVGNTLPFPVIFIMRVPMQQGALALVCNT